MTDTTTRCIHGMVAAFCATCLAPSPREVREQQVEQRARRSVAKRVARIGELDAFTLNLLLERAKLTFTSPPRHLDTLKAAYREATNELLSSDKVRIAANGDEYATDSNGQVGRRRWYWGSIIEFKATADEVERLHLGELDVKLIKGTRNVYRVCEQGVNDLAITLLKYGMRP